MIEKKNSIIIFSIFSIIFLIFGLISSFNYEGVVVEKEKIILENPGNVSLYLKIIGNNTTFSLSILIKNPSSFNLNMYTFTALIEQKNKTILEIWRSYYYYTLNPLVINAGSEKIIIYSGNVSTSSYSGNEFNITLQIMMRFSGFSYFYENPGENFSPQRYYLTDMVMISIERSENVQAQIS